MYANLAYTFDVSTTTSVHDTAFVHQTVLSEMFGETQIDGREKRRLNRKNQNEDTNR